MLMRRLFRNTQFEIEFERGNCDERADSIFTLLRKEEQRLILRLPPTQGWRIISDIELHLSPPRIGGALHLVRPGRSGWCSHFVLAVSGLREC